MKTDRVECRPVPASQLGSMIVELTAAELLVAGHAGLMRHVENLKNTHAKNGPRRGPPEHGDGSAESQWDRQIEGAAAEYAVAKHLGRFWPGKGTISSPDVHPNVEVRWARQHDRRLIVHDSDPDDRVCVFVTGGGGCYALRGWIYAKDAKRSEYADDPVGGRAAFFVPASCLKPLYTV